MKSHATSSKAQAEPAQPFSREKVKPPFFQNGGGAEAFFQPKLEVGSPHDPLEEEADRLADQVVQRTCASCEKEEEGKVRRKARGQSQQTSPEFESSLNANKGKGSPLPPGTRSFMEQGFGADFSGVRVHTGGEASTLNRQVQARAFTHGSDIFFDKGQFQPETREGKRLIAHELTHTIQQRGATKIQRSLAGLNQTVRSRIQLWNVRLDPTHLDKNKLEDYFRKNPPNSKMLFGGKKVIDPTVTQTTPQAQSTTYDVKRGLDNIPGHFISTLNMPLNTTATVHLDLSHFGGQNGTFRVTYADTNTKANKPAAREFHIEFLGAVPSTPTQSTRPGTITIGSNSFTASSWPDSRYDELVMTLNKIPTSALNQINGMQFKYKSGSALAHGNAMTEEGEATLEYGIPANKREIIIRSSAAAPNAINYEGLPRIAWVIAHEIGHWLDFMPIFNAAASATGPKVTPTNSLSGYTHMTATGDLKSAAGKNTTFHKLNKKNTAMSAYGATNAEESFAEYFAMYITSPNTLKQMRPNVHAYMKKKFP